DRFHPGRLRGRPARAHALGGRRTAGAQRGGRGHAAARPAPAPGRAAPAADARAHAARRPRLAAPAGAVAAGTPACARGAPRTGAAPARGRVAGARRGPACPPSPRRRGAAGHAPGAPAGGAARAPGRPRAAAPGGRRAPAAGRHPAPARRGALAAGSQPARHRGAWLRDPAPRRWARGPRHRRRRARRPPGRPRGRRRDPAAGGITPAAAVARCLARPTTESAMHRTAFAITLAASLFLAACQSAGPATSTKEAVAHAPPAPSPVAASPVLDRARAQAEAAAHQRMAMAPPAPPPPMVLPPRPHPVDPAITEEYADLEDNPVRRASEQPVSTFSVDVDTGSYSNVRRMLRMGVRPPPDAVRAEEFINYFRYGHPAPATREVPFRVSTEIAPSPWDPRRHLLMVGIKGYDVP